MSWTVIQIDISIGQHFFFSLCFPYTLHRFYSNKEFVCCRQYWKIQILFKKKRIERQKLFSVVLPCDFLSHQLWNSQLISTNWDHLWEFSLIDGPNHMVFPCIIVMLNENQLHGNRFYCMINSKFIRLLDHWFISKHSILYVYFMRYRYLSIYSWYESIESNKKQPFKSYWFQVYLYFTKCNMKRWE